MRNDTDSRRFRLASLVREVGGVLLPACVAAALFFLVPREGGTQGERRVPDPKEAPAAPCGTWHRGGGETSAVDLAAVKRAYKDLAAQVTRSVDRLTIDVSNQFEQPYDAGLPACRGRSVRAGSLPAERGARFRGRVLYFAAAPSPETFNLPPEIDADPRAEILILQTRKMKHVPELSKRLKRPVSLASAEFAKTLGVTCADTWVKISEKGDGLELHEGR